MCVLHFHLSVVAMSKARGVPSREKKLKPSVDDEQNERTEKNVKTKKKTTDNEVCDRVLKCDGKN